MGVIMIEVATKPFHFLTKILSVSRRAEDESVACLVTISRFNAESIKLLFKFPLCDNFMGRFVRTVRATARVGVWIVVILLSTVPVVVVTVRISLPTVGMRLLSTTVCVRMSRLLNWRWGLVLS
jgi:hypothetical protein